MAEENRPPGYEELMGRAGVAYRELRLEEALENYRAAQELQPASYDVSLGQARTLYRMRREQDAYRAAEKAVELDPQRPEGYATLGVLHFLTDRYAQATSVLQKAIALAPDSPEPHITLAQVYADEHKYAEARSELAMAREQVAAIPDEHEREALMALAWHSETYLLLAEGKDAEAIACAQEVVALKESNPYAACLAYSNLGIIEIRERHYDQGVEYLERAYQMNPYNHRVAGMLGRVLITRNRFARAAEVLERAVANSPSGSGTIRYFYGMALAEDRAARGGSGSISPGASGRSEGEGIPGGPLADDLAQPGGPVRSHCHVVGRGVGLVAVGQTGSQSLNSRLVVSGYPDFAENVGAAQAVIH